MALDTTTATTEGLTKERAVIFCTSGEFDLRGITTFGVNSKPTHDNPFGYFGTGLKYAIAVLMREGAKVSLHTDGHRYEFYVKDTDFRSKRFGMVKMKKDKAFLRTPSFMHAQYRDLPFTTELGKNWELWQAFRELESNTRDELGTTRIIGERVSVAGTLSELRYDHPEGVRPWTTFIVVESNAFAAEYDARNKTFLDTALLTKVEVVPNRLEVYERSSKEVYYRGIRVYTAEKPFRYTYNMLGSSVELTEDRSLKYPWRVEQYVTECCAATDNGKFISELMRVKESYNEHKWPWDTTYQAPSKTFQEIYTKLQRRGATVPHGIGHYAASYAPRPEPIDLFELYPRPWSGDSTFITDRNGNEILQVMEPSSHPDLAELLRNIINKHEQ